jgi:hypothetical protein
VKKPDFTDKSEANGDLSGAPEMHRGSQPTDDGNLILTEEEKEERAAAKGNHWTRSGRLELQIDVDREMVGGEGRVTAGEAAHSGGAEKLDRSGELVAEDVVYADVRSFGVE